MEAVANDWADHYAKKGRTMHEQPTEAMENDLTLQARDLAKVVALLLEWPSRIKAERLPASQRQAAKAKVLKDDGHVWQRLSGTWQCKRCLATTRSRSGLVFRTGGLEAWLRTCG